MEAFEDKSDTEQKKNPSFRGILVEFMGYTSGHGFGRLVEATKFLWRIFWTLAILGASGMFVVEVMDLFKLYLSRPVQTSVTVAFEKQINFPAVTICNLNMIKKSSAVMYLADELIARFSFPEKTIIANITEKPNEVVNITEKPTEAVNITEKPTAGHNKTEQPTTDTSPASQFKRKRRDEPIEDGYDDDRENGDEEDVGDDIYGEEDVDEDISDDYPEKENVKPEIELRRALDSHIGAYNQTVDLLRLGHQQYNLIQDCTWKSTDCRKGPLKMFWKWSWNFRYGNCYTFNDGVDEQELPLRVLKSSKPGPSQGLVLQLNIEENEYLGELTEEAGVRVVLHEPGVTAFPYEEGFSVAPGMATSVGLTKTLIKRLDRYGDGSCFKESVPLREDNLYKKYDDITRYSLQACLNSCLGESQLSTCACAEVSYPSIVVPCNLSEWKIRKCLKNVKSLFSKDQLPCIDKCKRPCREEVYEKTISSSQWPSPAREAYESLQSIVTSNRSNGLLLNIFYSQLNYQVIEETFSYGTTNLLADIGGQLGLWIGISALTCGEVLELIFNLLALAYMKLKNRRQNRVVEIGQTTG